MKKIDETKNFNIGKYLDCIYHFWNHSTNKGVFVNDLLSIFLIKKMPQYELDKASVSKLSTHKYDLTKNVKEIIYSSESSIAKKFVALIGSVILCPPDALASEIRESLRQSTEKDSESVRQLEAFFDAGDYEQFLFLAFKHASAMPNQPYKAKAKRGRKPRGSDNSVFYLSEGEKAFERNRLLTKIMKSNDRLTKQDLDEMIELMAYASLEFTQGDKELVARRFLQTWRRENEKPGKDLLFAMDGAAITFGPAKAERFSNWEKPIAEAEATLTAASLCAAYRKAIRQNSFADVQRLLFWLEQDGAVVNSDALKATLINNRFLLPDISGHITHSQWSYCLGIARISKDAGIPNEFCTALDELYPLGSRDNTVAERVEALSKAARGLWVC